MAISIQKAKHNFITKANKKYGSQYDYSNIEYVDGNTHIKIRCSFHGVFITTPNLHNYRSIECKSCKKERITKQKQSITNQICSYCHQNKSIKDFYRSKKRSEGVESVCKLCHKIKLNIVYTNNPTIIDNIKKRAKEYRIETNFSHSKAWYQNNKQTFSEYRKQWYQDNKEAILEQQTTYRKTYGKATRRSGDAKRRADLLNATPVWCDLTKITEIYAQAYELTKSSGIQYDVDHYFPLAGKTVCGLHIPENLVIIPHEENHKKLNKHPDDFYV